MRYSSTLPAWLLIFTSLYFFYNNNNNNNNTATVRATPDQVAAAAAAQAHYDHIAALSFSEVVERDIQDVVTWLVLQAQHPAGLLAWFVFILIAIVFMVHAFKYVRGPAPR